MRKVVIDNGKLVYFVSSDEPKLLIHSGTHGDESEVTDFVIESLEKYKDQLPPLIFVPEVSPSAVKLGTRNNYLNHDMNRTFLSDSTDPEVLANIEVVKNKKFDLFVSFHEDPTQTNYYLYDVGYKVPENDLVMKHNMLLKNKGVDLLNGIDDPDDPDLGYELKDGYIKMVHPKNYHDDGTISAWVLNRHITDEYLLPEIPGKHNRDTKRMIVDTFFSEVILKSFYRDSV